MSQFDVTERKGFVHEEDNEGAKIGVERGMGALFRAKLLKNMDSLESSEGSTLRNRDHSESQQGRLPEHAVGWNDGLRNDDPRNDDPMTVAILCRNSIVDVDHGGLLHRRVRLPQPACRLPE